MKNKEYQEQEGLPERVGNMYWVIAFAVIALVVMTISVIALLNII